MAKILSISNDVKLSRANNAGATFKMSEGTASDTTTIGAGMNTLNVFVWECTNVASGSIIFNIGWNAETISNQSSGSGGTTISGDASAVKFTPTFSGTWKWRWYVLGFDTSTN